jgi:hypothetical protein
MPPKTPKTGHFARVARECYAPISHEECGQIDAATAERGKGISSNPGVLEEQLTCELKGDMQE